MGTVETYAPVARAGEPDSIGGERIRDGVAKERRVSIEDPEMRHGRKSKNKLINGYKQHLAGDLDREIILAAAITPANRPEGEAGIPLKRDIDRQGLVISGAYFDRAYITSAMVKEILAGGGQVFCKPWMVKNGGLFTKAHFDINMRDRTITCPSGLETLPFEIGTQVDFDAETCDRCPVRSECTKAKAGTGRSVAIAADEQLQQRMRKLLKTPSGRARLRRRSRISLPVPLAGKGGALATAAPARISSHSAAPQQSTTFNSYSASLRPPRK